ncbi:MAG: DUF432 domain-containing protein [Verrucomicrobiales bacterium]|nr:DUF432 domain-containing protein [Verrucomicrobiales bacterium]
MLFETGQITWGRRSLSDQERTRLSWGSLLIELSSGDGEVYLASTNLDDSELGSDLQDAAIDWTSWAVCTGVDEVDLHPGFPDHSVLVKPEALISLEPGEAERVWVNIPPTVIVGVKDQIDQVLSEFPTVSLEQAWFGQPGKGEFCYELVSKAGRHPGLETSAAGIQCPVTIINQSSEPLNVTRFCLRVAGLTLYESGNGLWGNETVVKFQGGASVSRVALQSGPPQEAIQPEVLALPRERGSFKVVGRTFRTFSRRGKGDLSFE